MDRAGAVATAVVVSVALACGDAQQQAEPVAAPAEGTSHYYSSLAYTRVALDENGHSDFDEGEDHFELKDFAPPAGPLGVAAMRSAESLVFTTADADWVGDWHPSPRKQFVFMLAGAIEIQVEDGERRRFVEGDIILLEDTSGRGHDTRVVSETPALFAIVAMPE